MQSCFMFGHRDAPLEIQEKMECVVEQLYLEYGISTFYVGGYGAFDRIAGAAVKAAKTRFPEIRLYLLIPYHPAVRPVVLSEGYDGSYYPPLESVPQRFAIVKANQYMVKSCDAVICYASYPGNSKSLLEYAKKREVKEKLIIKNLGE